MLPLLFGAATFVVLRFVRPTRELRCARAAVGATASCELRERSTSVAPDQTFVLEGAVFETEHVATHTRRGSSSRGRLVVTPQAGESVVVRLAPAPLTTALQRMQGDPTVMDLVHDDAMPVGVVVALSSVWWILVIPVVALGGRLEVRVDAHLLEIVRVRAWVRGRRRVLALGPDTAVELGVHSPGPRQRGIPSLVLRVRDETVTLATSRDAGLLARISAELGSAIAAARAG